MNSIRLLSGILLAVSIAMAPAVRGAGMVMIDPVAGMPMGIPHIGGVVVHPIGGETPRPGHTVLKGGVSYALRLQDTDVKVEIADQIAKTYVTQTFANDSDTQLAGTYLFPMPDDASFSSFSLHIDGKPVEGKILEANEARTEYEQIVRRLVDPGLLEYADYKNVRARIFPIPPHGTKKVELEYTQLLHAENGMMKYRFPLRTEGSATADNVNIAVKMNSKQGLRTIWSPSHTISTERKGDHEAKIAFGGKDAPLDKDFFLYYSISDKDVAANLVTNKTSKEDGYYLLTLTPPVEAKKVNAKDIVLVADTSGSMKGDRLDESKKAMRYVVNALKADDHFSIVKFDTDIDCFKTKLLPATSENKKAALAFIDDLEAHGGTNISGALEQAVTMLNGEGEDSHRPAYLVLMTDGQPTVGDTSSESLMKKVDSKRDIRLFDFGVGYDINTLLLDKLAQAHHGTAQYVEPSENIETSLSNFYNKIESPVLTNVQIAYNGVDVKDVYPREVKDLFAGTQVLLVGKYKGSGDAKVELTGTVDGVKKAYSFPLKFADEDAGNSCLPRMWAMRRIAHLTDVAKENGDNREVVDEIVGLSKKYGIITAYTSFLVTDPNEIDAHGNPIGGRPVRAMDRVALRGAVDGPVAALPPPPLPMAAVPHAAPRPTKAPAMRMAALQKTKLDSFVAAVPPTGGGGFGDEGTASGTGWAEPMKEEDMRRVVMNFTAGNGGDGYTGKKAVAFEKANASLNSDFAVAQASNNIQSVKTAGDKTFYLRGDTWTDSAYDEKKSAKPVEVSFGSKEYFELLKTPGIGKFLAVGKQVLFVFNDKVYKITANAAA